MNVIEPEAEDLVADRWARSDLAEALDRCQPTWTTEELQEEFDVLGFHAPFVVVRRKSDNKFGSLEFQLRPRPYFDWKPHEDCS